MRYTKLDNLGKIEKGFKNPQRFVRPTKLIETPKLILKAYDMYIKEPSNQNTILDMEEFLINEINQGKIDSRIGLGFAILSKDMLNVVRWDNKYPIVAVNSIYEFPEENRDVLNSKPLVVDDFGAYCVWELGIVEHEKKAWKNYLASRQTMEDKLQYINKFINGKLK